MKFDAKEIVTKYISSLHTTDFAILYLPSEGLFAEVIRPPGLVEAIQYDCRVMIAGFAAAITSGIWWRTDADFAAYDRSLAKVRFWPGTCHSSGEHDRPLPRLKRKSVGCDSNPKSGHVSAVSTAQKGNRNAAIAANRGHAVTSQFLSSSCHSNAQFVVVK